MPAKSILDLFKTTGKITTSLGTLPKQYHVNNSNALLIFGSVNYNKVYTHINSITMNKKQTYYPIKFMDNRAPMVIWLSHFFDSNHGDHNELNFSTYISRNNQPIEYENTDINKTSFALFNVLTDVKTVATTPCAVYNNDAKVVAYNTEYLNLPARLAKGVGLEMNENQSTFEWIDDETNMTIISGNVVKKSSLRDVYALYKAIGLKQFWANITAPYLQGTVMNLDGLFADVYMQAPQQNTTIFSWNDNTDNIDIQHEVVKDFEYKPLICSSYRNFRFVYQASEQDKCE
eukprot:207110_1